MEVAIAPAQKLFVLAEIVNPPHPAENAPAVLTSVKARPGRTPSLVQQKEGVPLVTTSLETRWTSHHVKFTCEARCYLGGTTFPSTLASEVIL